MTYRTAIIAAITLAACGSAPENATTDSSDETAEAIVLRRGTYVGDTAYVRDTCDLYGAGVITTTIVEWLGNGMPMIDCTALDDGRWRCERWHDPSGDCQISGYENWMIEPVTDTSMYVEHTMQLTSTLCPAWCELRLAGTLHR